MKEPICDVCSKSCKSPYWLAQHCRTHSNERPWQCRFCGMRTNEPGNLKRHEKHSCQFRVMTSKNSSSGAEIHCQCLTCSKCRRRHREAKRFHCDICDKDFSHHSLRRHIIDGHLTRAAASANSRKCDECEKVFPKPDNLREHIKNLHNRPAGKLICPVCQKSYGTMHLLKLHRCVNNRSRVLFECDVCDKKFGSKLCYATHAANVHVSARTDIPKRLNVEIVEKIKNQRVMFQCSKCVHLFTTRGNLWRHGRKHEIRKLGLSSAESWRCRICDKIFYDKADLDHHVRIHEEKARFGCFLCKRDYSQSHQLIEHLRMQHSSPQILYKCDMCDDKQYAHKSFLFAHARRCHISDISADQIAKIGHSRQRFQCSKCVQSCASRGLLRRHELQQHSKTRTYFSCHFCDLTTLSKASLNRHVCNKHGKRIECFVCFNCKRQFSHIGTLRLHILDKHLSAPQRVYYQCDTCDIIIAYISNFAKHTMKCLRIGRGYGHIEPRKVPNFDIESYSGQLFIKGHSSDEKHMQ